MNSSCCNYNKNLIPILYEYENKSARYKYGCKMYGVSVLRCKECMSDICIDDSLDMPQNLYKDVNDYKNSVLWRFDIDN